MTKRVLAVVTLELDDEFADAFEKGEESAQRQIQETLKDLFSSGLGPIGPSVYLHNDTVHSAIDILERQFMKDIKEHEADYVSDFLDLVEEGEMEVWQWEDYLADRSVPQYRRDARVALAGGTVPDTYLVAGRTIQEELEERIDINEEFEGRFGEDDEDDEDDEGVTCDVCGDVFLDMDDFNAHASGDCAFAAPIGGNDDY